MKVILTINTILSEENTFQFTLVGGLLSFVTYEMSENARCASFVS